MGALAREVWYVKGLKVQGAWVFLGLLSSGFGRGFLDPMFNRVKMSR